MSDSAFGGESATLELAEESISELPPVPDQPSASGSAHSAVPAVFAGDIECRMAERFDVDGYAQVTVSDGSAVFRGRILNISLTGCFIQTVASVRLPVGSTVDLLFQLNGIEGPKHFHIHAEARFSKPRKGIGFRFLRLTPTLQQALDKIITALEAAKNPQPVVFAGSIECRLAERFDVDGDALVSATDGCTVFRGRILNLSLTGCFISTVAYIRFAVGTTVDLVFRLSGMEDASHFQIHAEARFSKPRVGVGFRFLRMTPAVHQELNTIIAALEDAKQIGPST